jgi:hypothetical protein
MEDIENKIEIHPGSGAVAGPTRRLLRLARLMEASLDEQDQYRDCLQMEICCTRIGQRFIHVGMGSEVCAPVGLRLKSQLRGQLVMVTGYTGHALDYFPASAQICGGGYEVFRNPAWRPYSPEAEDFLLADLMRLIEQTVPVPS